MVKLVVNGAAEMADVPGLEAAAERLEIAFAPDPATLARELPGTEILLGWNFRGRELPDCWHLADRLKWIHWGGAGVDAVLFPELIESDVVLTNARGVFDRAMAEYVLGLMLSYAKLLPETFEHQKNRVWKYRRTERLQGTRAVIFGVGSIARETAAVLGAVGVEVAGVGRSARSGVPVFGEVHSADAAHDVAAGADWVIGVLPGTEETRKFFDAAFFAAMKSGARFINIGRGMSVDETALLAALNSGTIAGAALDVFTTEPLPADDPLWSAPNLIVSPHISGDYNEYPQDLVAQFLGNVERYLSGGALVNVVDKAAGYVRD
ncbi:MAG: D-2-hydroxyacid dehydrogenase [Hyphomicrobiales bacterium]